MKSQVAAALLTCAAICKLGAQNPTATLVGTVTDPTGLVVVEAKLEIRNSATNEVRKLQSNHKGEFTVPNLAPGFYDVTISKDGFRSLRQTNLELQLDQEARVQFKLELGSVSQTVEVTGSVPLVNTENAAKGDVVVSQEMVEMPLNGRNFTDLALLVPGVLPNVEGGQGQSGMVINGARATNTNFLVDGFNNRNSRDSSAQARPNIDAIQEFKMQTSGYSAEYGSLAGGVLNMALKTGGNQLHGMVFEFLRNDVLDARNFFDRAKSMLRRNQFGGTVSGPVLIPKVYNGRDHTFFLFSWESYRNRQGQSALAAVPTLAQRQGDFSGLPPVKDPLATGACNATSSAGCFPNNQVPISRQSAVALAAQAYFPLPNRPGPNNFYAQVASKADWDSDVIKIDHRFSAADNLSIRYLKRYSRGTSPFNQGNTGVFGLDGGGHTMLMGLTYTRMFSPTVINEARLGFTRTTEEYAGVHQGIDYNKQFGISGGPADSSLVGFPQFRITNYDRLGDNPTPPKDANNYFQIADTVTLVRGSHMVKFGGDILRSQTFQPGRNNVFGTYNFTGAWTSQPYADFLLGLPNSTSRQFQLNTSYLFSTNYSLFFQDDWKVASRLTLNLGLRYDLSMPLHDKYGRWTNFVPELGKLVIASDATLAGTGIGFINPAKVGTAKQLGLPEALVYPNYKNFAPRIGLAWRPFGGNRTVVRGGYGIFYGTMEQDVQIRLALGNVFPFATTATVNRRANDPNFLTISNPFPVPPTLINDVINANGYQLHAPTPYLQSWNLTMEREIGLQSAIEISYVGSKGTHLGRGYDINQPFRSAATAPNFPVPYTGWSSINYYGFYFNSGYNAGSIALRRRFAHGFFYRASFIHAKSIDNGSQINGYPAGGAAVQDSRNLRAERGRSDFDIGNSFTTSFSWAAPSRSHVLLRGWQLAGTGSARTGTPITPQLSNVNLSLGEANRPNRTAKGTVSNPTPDRWFDVSAFPAVPAGSFAFGNSGRNILDGPGSIGINLSLSRNFVVRERNNLQFRWELFNTLNHANFKRPIALVNQPNAATITSAGEPRLMQFGLRYSF